jgi:hypothetical protein
MSSLDPCPPALLHPCIGINVLGNLASSCAMWLPAQMLCLFIHANFLVLNPISNLAESFVFIIVVESNVKSNLVWDT